MAQDFAPGTESPGFAEPVASALETESGVGGGGGGSAAVHALCGEEPGQDVLRLRALPLLRALVEGQGMWQMPRGRAAGLPPTNVGGAEVDTSSMQTFQKNNLNEIGSDAMPSASLSSSSAWRPDTRLERVVESAERADERSMPSVLADQYVGGPLPGTTPKAAARKRRNLAHRFLEQSITQLVRREVQKLLSEKQMDIIWVLGLAHMSFGVRSSPCHRMHATVHRQHRMLKKKSRHLQNLPFPVSSWCGGEPKQGMHDKLVEPAEAVPCTASDDKYQEEELDCELADVLGDEAKDFVPEGRAASTQRDAVLTEVRHTKWSRGDRRRVRRGRERIAAHPDEADSERLMHEVSPCEFGDEQQGGPVACRPEMAVDDNELQCILASDRSL